MQETNKKESPSMGHPSAQIGTSATTGIAAPPPPPKRSKRDEADDWDSQSESSGEGNDGASSTHSGQKVGKDGTGRMSLRKEKKSAREKARRQRENALFEELANMCNVPADTRDKSSVLKAVIRRVEELRSKNNGAPPGARLTTDMLQGIPGFPAAYSAAAANGQPTVDDLLLAASRGAWGMPTVAAPPPPPPPTAQIPQATQSASQYHHNGQMFPSSFSTLNSNNSSYALPQSTGSFNYMNSQPASNNLAPMFPNMFQGPQLGGFSPPQQNSVPPAPQQHNAASVYGNPALNGTLNISPSNAAGLSSNLKMFVPDFLMHRSGEASDLNNNRA